MAGTDKNSITAADWRLASDELAFVVELVGAEERALEVMGSLLDDLAKGLIRWDCDDLVVRGDFQANPSLRIMFAAARGRAFFWRRDEHSRLNVDWPTSCAAWMGPLSGFGSDGIGNSWPTFDPCVSTSLTASGVRFHHGDVMDRLVARGLMPQPPAPPPSSPPSPEPPIAPRVEAAPAAPVSQDNLESELPSATVVPVLATTPTTRLGRQERLIAEVALEIYGEDLPLLTPTELQQAIEARQKAKTLKTQLPPHWVPSWDACKRFLEKRGKRRLR
jgi:hypothetical protein